MIIPLAATLLVVPVLLLGGRTHRLWELRFHRPVLIVTAFLLRVLLLSLDGITEPLLRTGTLVTYALAAGFLWLNRKVPGMVLAGLGTGANALVITANGGVLPADPQALDRAGTGPGGGWLADSREVVDARLDFLGDLLPVPAPWPLGGLCTIGDVIVLVALGWAVHRICGTRRTEPWDARAAGHAWPRHRDRTPVLPVRGVQPLDRRPRTGRRGRDHEPDPAGSFFESCEVVVPDGTGEVPVPVGAGPALPAGGRATAAGAGADRTGLPFLPTIAVPGLPAPGQAPGPGSGTGNRPAPPTADGPRCARPNESVLPEQIRRVLLPEPFRLPEQFRRILLPEQIRARQ